MCNHNAKHDDYMLCPQCDMLVELPSLMHGQKAVCPRCKTTLANRQNQARQRSIGFAFSALLMLALANAFPFIYMRVAGITSEISLFEIPQVMVSDNYASVAFLFMLFVQVIPALSMVMVILLSLRSAMPSRIKRLMATWLFWLKSWGMAEIFLAGVLVSFVKLMSYGDIGVGTGFVPYVLFCLLQLLAYQSLDRRSVWNDVAPAPQLLFAPEAGRSGLAQGLRSCTCCPAILPADQWECPRCHRHGHARRKNSLQWTLQSSLNAGLPGWTVSSQPLGAAPSELAVTVKAFHGRYDGKAVVQGEWTLQRGDRLLRQPFNLVLPLKDDGYDALVATLAQGWQQVAQSIAAQIQRSE